MSEDFSTVRPRAHSIWGMHGGYFLTGHARMAQAFEFTERALEANPQLVYNMEIEAYTLDRLSRGAQLDVEKLCDGEPWQSEQLLDVLRKAIDAGRMDNVSTYTQPILHALDGEAVVRQFGYARRIQRETLGIELEYYAAQEPCWCGQIPAILSGFDMKGCVFETSWGPYGFAPLKQGETFRWRGPDGSAIRTIPMAPYTRVPLPDDPEDKREWAPWCNPITPGEATIFRGLQLGVAHPVYFCLSLDLTPGRPEPWFNPCRVVGDDCDITFTTIGPYLDIARDDGIWEDAFAEFTDRLCWGAGGGDIYLNSQVAANKTILTERLGVLAGLDLQHQTDLMWQATMVSHHHDCWLCWPSMFGQFKHGTYFNLIHACRLEVEQRMADALPEAAEPAFRLANPTQRRRKEWAPVDIPLPAGAIKDAAGVCDADGGGVPSRLTVAERHADGSAARVVGNMLADVDGLSTTRYSLAEQGDDAELPVSVDPVAAGGFELGNGLLRVSLSEQRVQLFRGDEQVLADIYLHAIVSGWDTRSKTTEVSAEITPAGCARGQLKGIVGTIPFVLTLELKPWSDALDIHVACDYDGDRTESLNYWQIAGNMKLMLEGAQAAEHLCHQPFELRRPTKGVSSAVHFALTRWTYGGGFATIVDRPSGMLFEERTVGVSLCHSGWYHYAAADRPDVGADRERFSNDCSHGTRQYDVAVVPFDADDEPAAVWAYQRQAYPLTPLPDRDGPLPVPGLKIDGHSLLSGMYREDDAIVMRFWNPLEAETFKIAAPGMTIATTNLEGRHAQELGTDCAQVPMRPMQIQTLRLVPAIVSH